MSTTEDRIGELHTQIKRLETTARRQRIGLVALACTVSGYCLLGMTQGSRHATFDTITCKGWRVVDGEGKERIAARTADGGAAGIDWIDSDGNKRITAVTAFHVSEVHWLDSSGQLRIVAGTGGKSAGFQMYDTKSLRMTASTTGGNNFSVSVLDTGGKARLKLDAVANGDTTASWFNKEGETRIRTGVLSDGTLILPTVDPK